MSLNDLRSPKLISTDPLIINLDPVLRPKQTRLFQYQHGNQLRRLVRLDEADDSVSSVVIHIPDRVRVVTVVFLLGLLRGSVRAHGFARFTERYSVVAATSVLTDVASAFRTMARSAEDLSDATCNEL